MTDNSILLEKLQNLEISNKYPGVSCSKPQGDGCFSVGSRECERGMVCTTVDKEHNIHRCKRATHSLGCTFKLLIYIFVFSILIFIIFGAIISFLVSIHKAARAAENARIGEKYEKELARDSRHQKQLRAAAEMAAKAAAEMAAKAAERKG